MKIFKLTNVLGAALIGLASFSSCTDACKDVDCGPGTCLEGTCTCPDGFSGTNCGTEDRAQFTGSFLITGTVTGANAGTFSDESMVNSTSSTASNKFSMNILGGAVVVTCTAGTGTNGFAVDASTFDGCDYTGSGTITGNNLSMTLNETCGTDNSVITLTGIKQ
ncbi:MAG: hypothetical protein ACI85F_002916 [Bacteroidia bacterium]|jgi:hypothetical protein